jgi:methyltransferase (TIGR00027 family)
VKRGKPSSSAQTVALVRAHLHEAGIIDDPLAAPMLTPSRRAMARALRRRPLTRWGRNPGFSFLAARTRFFDDAVVDSIDEGTRQVVVVGAGYDTRAWRLARDGVRFFEVDHPATQQDKRARAPAGGPVYVPVDLSEDAIDERLLAAGLEPGDPSVFVVEGLTMYLPETTAEDMFARLATVAGPGSRLAVNFTGSGGGSVAPASRAVSRLMRARWRASGEVTYHWANRGDVSAVLDRTGWTQVEQLTGPKVAARYLAGGPMDVVGVNPDAFCVTARRQPRPSS